MIYLRGRIWWLQFRRNGRKICRSTGLTDRKAAQSVAEVMRLALCSRPPRAVIESLLDEIYSGTGETRPLATVWDDYARLARAAGKEPGGRTMADRRNAWTEFVADALKAGAADDVRRLGRSDAVGFAGRLARSARKSKTRRNMIDNLSAVWNTVAAELGLPKIFEGLRPRIDDAEERMAFSPAAEAAVLAAARTVHGGRWWLASMIARWTGLRYSDICGLEWAGIGSDWVLRMKPHKTEAHGIRVTIPIAGELRAALEDAKARATSPWVLPAHHRTTCTKGDWHPFADVLKAAGVEGPYTFHSWRHTFRTRLAEAGVSDDIAKRLGGWTDDSTAARYDHAERIAEAAAAIESTRRSDAPKNQKAVLKA